MKTHILDLGSTPLADQFPVTVDEAHAQTRFPLGLTVDEDTWTVELTHQVPDEALFGDDYAFLTGASPTLQAYFREYSGWVRGRFPEQLKRGVCEVACNDGTLLQHFRELRHLGIDPAKPAVREAERRGLTVLHQAFDLDTAHAIDEPFGVVIANNVAAHVADLTNLLAGVAHLTRGGGVGVLEFQYAGDLLGGCLWPLVYHEHRRFLSLTSFIAALPAELHVVDVTWMDVQGGSLRVVVSDTDNATVGQRRAIGDWLSREDWLRRPDIYTSFQGRVHRQVARLWDAVSSFGRVALYGAPAKATTLVHYAELAGTLRYAVDLTPGKIGRYLPGTGVPVIGPDQEHGRPSAYLVAVSNYLPAILRREHEFLADGGHLILPDGTVI